MINEASSYKYDKSLKIIKGSLQVLILLLE